MRIFLQLFIIIVFSIGNFAIAEEEPSPEESIVSYLNKQARDLENINDLDFLIESAGQNTLVLLGEASHGTSEYYSWRKNISRRLIEEKDFSFIAVEGDWPLCFPVNKYVKGLEDTESTAELLVQSFERWPQWMWANTDVLELIEWLRQYNMELPLEERIGFYGMDMQSFEASIFRVKEYLAGFDDEKIRVMKDKYRVFEKFNYDGITYARAVHLQGVNYREEVSKMVDFLHEHASELRKQCEYEYFNARQNAKLVKNAENYFRHAVMGGPEGWNIRVRHMEEAVYNLLDYYGMDSRGVVWAHNTHVGDARQTAMKNRGQVNIGQLARQELGEDNVFIVGFSTYTGTVMAGREWGANRQIMDVPQAKKNSLDELLSRVDKGAYWLYFTEECREHAKLSEMRGQRAIGVVYNPEREHLGNYVPTSLPHRYDALLFFRETKTVSPLN